MFFIFVVNVIKYNLFELSNFWSRLPLDVLTLKRGYALDIELPQLHLPSIVLLRVSSSPPEVDLVVIFKNGNLIELRLAVTVGVTRNLLEKNLSNLSECVVTWVSLEHS